MEPDQTTRGADAGNDGEKVRQAALDSYRILDSGSEQPYDDLVKLACLVCDTRHGAISFIDHDRQWFKARIGPGAPQGARSDAICDHAIRDPQQVTEVADVRRDPRFADHAAIAGIGFYAGAPILSADGHAIGVLCVLDPAPRALTPAQREALSALARQVQHLLELRRLLQRKRKQFAAGEREHAELRRRHDDLRRASLRDPLTGLLNRNALRELMVRPDMVAWMQQHSFGLLLIDIDHFKRINDRLGHLEGDRVLREVADVVQASIRLEDIAWRYGGEELLVVLPDTPMAGMREVAERIRQRVMRITAEAPVTVSIGIACAKPGEDPREAFARADEALYRAKAQGRNRLVAENEPRPGHSRERTGKAARR